MVDQLMTLGACSAIIAVGSFSGAVRETFKMSQANLKTAYDKILHEPVPERLTETLNKLGDEGFGGY